MNAERNSERNAETNAEPAIGEKSSGMVVPGAWLH
jgi:hypothetical protein